MRKCFEYVLGEWLLHADNKQNLAFTEACGILKTLFWACLPNSAHYLQHVSLHMHQHMHFTAPFVNTQTAFCKLSTHIFLFVHQTHQRTKDLWENYAPACNSFYQSTEPEDVSLLFYPFRSFAPKMSYTSLPLPLHLLLSPTLCFIPLLVLF